MNYTELEAKVREATNNEPWGASTTLQQEIAAGTYSYQGLNEIMPMLYKRFTEKTAEEWRQIYKALQLLEFLIKNGSERVVDDARSHLSLLKMLRQFQFHDQNGKDQGINVRNRAKELAELLGDVDKIRAERKKARANRNKYGGVEGGAGFAGGSSSRYGGFGSEDTGDYGGYSGGVYGDGGGFGGQADSGFNDSSHRRDKFEEYDEGDDGGSSSHTRRTAGASSSSAAKKPAPPPKAKEPEVDLFEFGDDDVSAPAAAPASIPAPTAQPAASSAADDFDDFDDFVSGEPAPAAPASHAAAISPPPMTTSNIGSSTTFAAPKPLAAASPAPIAAPPSGPNYNISLASFSNPPSTSATPSMASTGFSSPPASSTASYQPMSVTNAAQTPKPSGYQPTGPNYFTSVKAGTSSVSSPVPSSIASPSPLGAGGPKAAPKPAAGGDAFASLWGSASGTAGLPKKTAGPNLSAMAKEKASAGIWGAPAAKPAAPAQNQPKPSGGGNGLDDLLG